MMMMMQHLLRKRMLDFPMKLLPLDLLFQVLSQRHEQHQDLPTQDHHRSF
jgi:hypothetical protein